MRHSRRSAALGPGLLAAVLIALSAGCSSSGEPRTTVDARSAVAGTGDFRLVHLDSDFKDTLEVENVSRRVVDGFLQVQVTLRSRTSEPAAIETSWEWYDGDGFRVEAANNAWIPALLGGRTRLDVRGVAPRDGIDSFKFHVRASMPVVSQD